MALSSYSQPEGDLPRRPLTLADLAQRQSVFVDMNVPEPYIYEVGSTLVWVARTGSAKRREADYQFLAGRLQIGFDGPPGNGQPSS